MLLKSILSLKQVIGCLRHNQIRTAMILRRKTRPPYMQRIVNPYVIGPFFESSQKQPHLEELRDHLYDEVEDTNTRPLGTMKVILLQHVDELGIPGDIVEVPVPYGRFQLISAKKADYYCDYNLKKYKSLIESGAEGRTGPSSAFVMTTVRKLANEVVLVEMNPREQWQVEKRHVKVALRKAGYVVPEEAIELPKTPINGPDIENKEGKDFAIEITINNQEKVAVRCMIHHIGQSLSPNWFRAPRFVLLPEEQSELLSKMPVQERPEEELEKEDEYVSQDLFKL